MTSIIKYIERAADELKLSFKKDNRVLLHTSRGWIKHSEELGIPVEYRSLFDKSTLR